MDIIRFVLDNIVVVVWLVAVVVAYVWKGKKLAFGVATIGLASIIYSKGRKDERTASESRQQAKERRDVQTVQKNRIGTQALADTELDKEIDKWTRD